MSPRTHTRDAVSWPYLVPVALLALFTTSLSAIAVFNSSLFYSAMNMTVPGRGSVMERGREGVAESATSSAPMPSAQRS